MSFEEIIEKVEKDIAEQKRSREEYYAANKGKRSCDECSCSYESCACKTVGGLCAYEQNHDFKEDIMDREFYEITMKQANGSLMTALENQIQADVQLL